MKLYVGGVCQGQEELARSENPGCEVFADFHETIRSAVLRDGQESREFARKFCVANEFGAGVVPMTR